MLLSAILLSACSAGDDHEGQAAASPAPEVQRCLGSELQAPREESYEGLPLVKATARARKAGAQLRIVGRATTCLPRLSDAVGGRINVYLDAQDRVIYAGRF